MVFRIPASAGMTLMGAYGQRDIITDSRIRGDERNKMAVKWTKSTGSPHPRGWKALLANLGC